MTIAAAPRRQPNLKDFGVAALAFVFGAAVSFGIAFLVLKQVPDRQAALGAVIGTATIGYVAIFFSIVFLWQRRQQIDPAALGLRKPGMRMMHLLWQLPLAFVTAVSVQALMYFATSGENGALQGNIDKTSTANEALAVGGTAGAMAVFIAFAIAVPLSEEILFRGYFYGALRQRMRLIWVFIVSAAVFAAIHFVPVLFPYLFTMGLLLAWLRTFHGNLWAPLCLHIVVNSIAGASILAAVSS